MRLHHLLTNGDGSPPVGVQQQRILSQPSPKGAGDARGMKDCGSGEDKLTTHMSQGQGVTRTCTPKATWMGPAERVGQLVFKKIPNLVFNTRIVHKKASSVSPPIAYRLKCWIYCSLLSQSCTLELNVFTAPPNQLKCAEKGSQSVRYRPPFPPAWLWFEMKSETSAPQKCIAESSVLAPLWGQDTTRRNLLHFKAGELKFLDYTKCKTKSFKLFIWFLHMITVIVLHR